MNPQMLLAHFDRLTDAPNSIPCLRSFIVSLAVRGKLVKQVPSEGAGSDTLAEIRKLKAQMILDHGVRGVQEVEFSIPPNDWGLPATWPIVTVDDIGLVQGGKRLPKGATYSTEPTNHIYVRVTDMKNGTITYDDLRYITPEVQRAISQYTISRDDLYITIAGTIGQVGRVPNFVHGHNLTENAAKIVFRGMNPNYLCLALSSDLVQQQFKDKTKQMAQPKLALKRILGSKFPLPPLAEQHRIVAKVDELMALCDRLEAAKAERERRRDRLVAVSIHHLTNGASAEEIREHSRFYINHLSSLTTRPDQIRSIRKTILDLAVRGKLVPQNSADDPPCDLLKQLQTEKAQSFGNGRSLDNPAGGLDGNDEVPFAIPESWKWARLSATLVSSFYGPRFGADEYSSTGIPTIRTTDMTSGGRIVLRDPPKVNVPLDRLNDFKCEKGDLLVTRTGSIGTMAIFDGDYPAIPSAYLIRLRFSAKTCVAYVHTSLKSPYGQTALGLNTTKVAQPNINAKNLAAILIPYPPLEEQHRILAKVDELMAVCDQLEAQLATTQSEGGRLLEAVLNQALNGNIQVNFCESVEVPAHL